jgi:hypothetical protein
MTQLTALPRTLLIYGLSLALAVVLGFLLADPGSVFNFFLATVILMALFTPLLMRWHHFMLVASLNAAVILFFLPGQPQLWMLAAGLSLGFSILRRSLEKDQTFLQVPMVTWPLVGLTLVVIATAKLSGGIGFQALGGGVHGGKRYLTLLGAVVAYFALTSSRIPLARVGQYCQVYFLMGISAVCSNLAYIAGPAFYILYNIFPVEIAMSQAMSDYTMGGLLARITGISYAGSALFCAMLLHYGVKGLFDITRPWRIVGFLGVIVMTLLGGYRSFVVLFGMVLTIQFFLERLYRTRIFLVILAVIGLLAVVMLPNVKRLPTALQRSLSVLPFLEVSPMAKWDAQMSTQWRLDMWKILIPQVPKYLIKGKGYAIDPTESYLIQESLKRGLAQSYEGSLVAGDYHNGPLSVIIPFGLFGLLFFVWFCLAGLRVMQLNYRYGPPAIRRVNTFFYSYYLAKIIFFFGLYGALNNDMISLTALVGLSVACNGGVCRPVNEAPGTAITSISLVRGQNLGSA